MVFGQRGGYCFEVNGLLLFALQSLGFMARALLGRVHIGGETTGRGHQVCFVTIDGKDWIVDTGFGYATPPVPIPFELNSVFVHEDRKYRILEDALFGFMLQFYSEGEWESLYSFETTHVCQGDIAYGNHFTSTSLESKFVNARVAAFPVPDGMITLVNFQLKKVIHGKEEIIQLEDNSSYLDALRYYFKIELNEDYEKLKPI